MVACRRALKAWQNILVREQREAPAAPDVMLEVGDLCEFELQHQQRRVVQIGGIMWIVGRNRRHNVALDQARTATQERQQPLMIVAVEL